jgi:hypothetical protein
MSRRTQVILGLVAIIALIALVEHLWVTDEEAIRALLDDVRVAVLARDLDGCFRDVSPGCTFNGRPRSALREAAEKAFRTYKITAFAWMGRSVLVEEGGRANVHVDVVLRGEAGGQQGAYRAVGDISLEETPEGWKITSVRVQ